MTTMRHPFNPKTNPSAFPPKACGATTAPWKDKWMRAECRSSMSSLNTALYAPMLETWLQHFDPSQFILISSQTYFEAPNDMVAQIADALALPAQASIRAVNAAVSSTTLNNRGNHPKLEEETPEVVDAIKRFFRPHVTRLKGLCEGSQPAMKLIGKFPWLQ